MQNAQNHELPAFDTASVEHGVIRCPDMESFSQAHGSSWEVDDEQLGPGPLDATIRYWESPRAAIVEEQISTSWRAGGALTRGTIAICLPDSSGLGGRWWGRELPHGTVPFARNGEEIDLVFQPGHKHTNTLLCEKLFRDIYSTVTGTEPDFMNQTGNGLNIGKSRFNALRRSVRQLQSTFASEGPPASLSFEESLAEVVAKALAKPLEIRMTSSRCRGLVLRAIEVFDRNPSRTHILDICRALNVSKRTLEYAFRQNLQASPSSYFKTRRINRVRVKLLKSDPKHTTVTQVTSLCGVSELGRFAGIYRRYFGEYPSQTLARSTQR